VGCPKGKYINGRCKVGMRTQSYLFSKDKGWTVEKAKSWYSSHQKGTATKKEASEKEVKLRQKLGELMKQKDALLKEMDRLNQEEYKEEDIERKKIEEKRKPQRDKINKELENIQNEIQVLHNAIGAEMAED